jgi:hypothetical protein
LMITSADAIFETCLVTGCCEPTLVFSDSFYPSSFYFKVLSFKILGSRPQQ